MPEWAVAYEKKSFSFLTKGFENPGLIFLTPLLHVNVISETVLLWKKSLALKCNLVKRFRNSPYVFVSQLVFSSVVVVVKLVCKDSGEL
jgi:hypothetical protein